MNSLRLLVNQYFIIIVSILLLLACGGKNKESNVEAPGAEKTPKTKTLEVGAEVIQDKTPVKQLSMYLDGFHFYSGQMEGQMEAHHYCTKLNEDVTQCVIFDGNDKDAKIMGVEYIISEKLFKTLAEEERKLWHSHVYEVKSGTLIAPGLPKAAEHELMEEIVSTYGKTFHTWHTDKDLELPLGTPQLMMGFTKDGQLKSELKNSRDERLKISSEKNRQNRADIPTPTVQPGANAWEKGEVRQLGIVDEQGKVNRASHMH
jgi:hypothetical protein